MVAIMAMRDRSVAWCVLQPPLARWPPWLAASPPQSKPSRSLAAQWLWLAKSSPPNSRCPQTARLSRSTCPPRKEVGSTSAIHFRWFWFTLAKMDGRVSCGMKKSACDQYWWWAWMSSPVLFWVFFYLFFLRLMEELPWPKVCQQIVFFVKFFFVCTSSKLCINYFYQLNCSV